MAHNEFGFFLLCLGFVMLPGKKSAKNSEEGQLKVWNFNTFVIGSHVAYLGIFLIFPEGLCLYCYYTDPNSLAHSLDYILPINLHHNYPLRALNLP